MSQEGRTLVVVRHAKSDWSTGVADRERPLNGRGRRDAQAAARWFADGDLGVDLAVVSPALRTLETWAAIDAALERPPPRTIESRIYEAEWTELLNVVNRLAPEQRCVALVGHNPGSAELVEELAGADGPVEPRARLSLGYPTLGIATLRFDCQWSAIRPATGVLQDFTVPRGDARGGKGFSGEI